MFSFFTVLKIAALVLLITTVAWVAKAYFRSSQDMRDPVVCTPAIKERIEKVCGKGLLTVARLDYKFFKEAADGIAINKDGSWKKSSWDAKRTAIQNKYERLRKANEDTYKPQVEYLWSLDPDSPVERDNIAQRLERLHEDEERIDASLKAQEDKELEATYIQEEQAEKNNLVQDISAMKKRNDLTRKCLALYSGPEKPCLFSAPGWQCSEGDVAKMRKSFQTWPTYEPLSYEEGQDRAWVDVVNEGSQLFEQWRSIFKELVAHCEQQLRAR